MVINLMFVAALRKFVQSSNYLQMYGLHLNLSFSEGDFLSLDSLPETIPAQNMMRLLESVRREVGSYLEPGSLEQLDAFLEPAPTLLNSKAKKRKTARAVPSPPSSVSRKMKKRQSTAVKVI